jgi:hypothetical protein
VSRRNRIEVFRCLHSVGVRIMNSCNDVEPAFGCSRHVEVGFLPTFQTTMLPLSSELK